MDSRAIMASMAIGAAVLSDNSDYGGYIPRRNLQGLQYLAYRPQGDDYRISKKYKVSAKTLARRKKQSDQKKARKITKSNK